MTRRTTLFMTLLISVLLPCAHALAHVPGQSLITLHVEDERIRGTLKIYYSDLPLIIDGLPFNVPATDDPNRVRHDQMILDFMREHIHFYQGLHPLDSETHFVKIQEIDDQSNVIVALEISPIPANLPALIIEQKGFYKTNPQFTTLVTLHTGTQFKTIVLSRQKNRAELFIAPLAEALAFLRHGLTHITLGVDHIFFILLLIFSPFLAGQAGPDAHWRTPAWSLVKLATAFTVAHSITLAMAAYKVFFLPAYLVELLVIFSIVFMGLHNLLRFDIKREWLIVFAFGLFHGYGFSAGLKNLGLSREHLVLPLVSFNVGVELGQMLIIGTVFGPLYLLVRQRVKTIRLIRYATILITLIAGLWLLEKFSG